MVQPAENQSHLNEAWLCELSLAHPTCCGVGKDLNIFFVVVTEASGLVGSKLETQREGAGLGSVRGHEG